MLNPIYYLFYSSMMFLNYLLRLEDLHKPIQAHVAAKSYHQSAQALP